MKEANFLKLDYTLQKFIGIPLMIFTPFLYGLLLLLPFGIWQVISSLTMVFAYKDRKRVPHLVFTVVYTAIFLIFMEASWVPFPLGFSYLILLPACIGIWYFVLTKKDYQQKNSKKAKEEAEYV